MGNGPTHFYAGDPQLEFFLGYSVIHSAFAWITEDQDLRSWCFRISPSHAEAEMQYNMLNILCNYPQLEKKRYSTELIDIVPTAVSTYTRNSIGLIETHWLLC